MAAVAEYISVAVTSGMPKRLLHMQGKSIDADTHVHWLHGQPNRFCLQLHVRLRSSSATQLVGNSAGSIMVQPLGLRRLIAGAGLAARLTATGSSAGLLACVANRRAQ
jgi:hypothetical protein